MIRINLLPAAKRVASSSGSTQLWGAVYLLGIFAWGVLLFFFYMSSQSKLDEQRAANSALEQEINQAKQKSANIGDVEAKLAKSRQLEDVVGKLQTARQGPTRVLMELSQLLSEAGGPSVSAERLDQLRRDNPLAGFNPGWDVRRLWLTAFTEQTRKCSIRGFGRTNEDVAEFLRRLNLSNLFEKVTLQATSSSTEGGGSAPSVAFELSCQVRY
ncbi:MAG: PilN domain-containing protein [Polyangiales bacterium]